MRSTRSSRAKQPTEVVIKGMLYNLRGSARSGLRARKKLYYGEDLSEDDDENDDKYGQEAEKAKIATVTGSSSTQSDPAAHIHNFDAGHPWFVEEDSNGGRIFKSLPVEVHQHIVNYLPADRDVAIYGRICKETESALSMSVWRMRFERTFDKVEAENALAIARKYAFRRAVSKQWTVFDVKTITAHMSPQIQQFQNFNREKCLQMITDLILESNARKIKDGDGNEVILDLNLQFLRNLTTMVRLNREEEYVDILDSILNTDYPWESRTGSNATSQQTTILIVQLCLSAIILDPNYCNTKASHFDMSQRKVYGNQIKHSLFWGKNKQIINLPLLLHTVNFFKFHFKSGIGEGLLCHAYKELEPDQFPQNWLGHIKAGTQHLGSHWKGSFTYMDNRELHDLRCWKADGGIYSDAVDDNSFQDMSFFFDDAKFPASDWPAAWDGILESDPFSELDLASEERRSSPRKKQKGFQRPEIKQFWGSSRGVKNGHIYGRIHALSTQQGIHGFQRVTMMKFFANEDDEYDPEQVWAYEGCVLPGGRIIMGRWRDARADPSTPDETYSGPFIFWNVDRSTVFPPIKDSEALTFAQTIHDPMLTGN